MPELPEVETVRCGLDAALTNATIHKITLRRKNLRIPFPENFARILTGRTILQVRRRAKYLLFTLDSDDILIAHLGMTGRFSVCHPALIAGSPSLREMPQHVRHDSNLHDHVLIELKDGRTAVYNDARRFGLMTLAKKNTLAKHPLLCDLGPEPLDKDFSAGYLKRELMKRSGPVKSVVMDQKLVVGVGNIYASEALFLAGIDPRKPAKKAADKADGLHAAIRKVLNDAIASGGSSLRDFLHVSGESGYFQHRFNVYDRKGNPCFSCQTPIRSTRLAGRSTFFCEHCQR